MPVPARPASTLLLTRERDGLEVYMQRRNRNLEFLGGYYVFPGGRRDEIDLKARVAEVESPEDNSLKLGSYAAAIREAFEEAGIFIACHQNGELFAPEGKTKDRLAELRTELHKGKSSFIEILTAFDLFYDLDRLFWFAHWITPEFSPRRFDTQFFIAELPTGQTPQAFAEEADEEVWIKPQKALDLCESGGMFMIPPTIASLARLRDCQTFSEAARLTR